MVLEVIQAISAVGIKLRIIALPDIEEQSKIADYLDTICESIENIVDEKKE